MQPIRAWESEQPMKNADFMEDFNDGGFDESGGVDEGGGGASEETGGVLVRWKEDKGFGFIQPNDGSEDVFVHFSGLADGDGSVNEGDQVKYYKEFNDRKGKYQAVDVRMDPSFTRPAVESEKGTVMRWNFERGFGFIQPESGGEDLFCHVSALLDGDGSVQEGDEVTYTKQFNARKGNYAAVDCKMVEGFVRTSPPPEPEFSEGDAGAFDFGGDEQGEEAPAPEAKQE
jgi:cold shock CspA family protein